LGHSAFVMAAFLHPRYQRILSPIMRSKIPSLALRINAGVPSSFLREVAQYSARENAFRSATFPCDHVDTWWTFFSEVAPQLVRFARRILAVPVGHPVPSCYWQLPGSTSPKSVPLTSELAIRLRAILLRRPYPAPLEERCLDSPIHGLEKLCMELPMLPTEPSGCVDSFSELVLEDWSRLVPIETVLDDQPFTLLPSI
jgi:hypothetical protein